METVTIPQEKFTSGTGAALYVGVELSAREWRLACSAGMHARVHQVVIAVAERAQVAKRLQTVLQTAKMRCGLAADAPVRSCYEAGREGFWPHRLLEAMGVRNVVVDSSSIEVNRRARRAKTDRLDATKLVRLLLRTALGETDVWHVVHVPTPTAEAARHAPRMMAMLIKERTRWRNRIHSVLATVGIRLPITATWPTQLAAATTWAGAPVPPAVVLRAELAWRMLQQVDAELRTLRAAQRQAMRTAASEAATTARQLAGLRGIGERFAWVMATEVCARDLHNRRQVGGLTGFTSVPYQSGDRAHDQGISRAGLAAVRSLAVETAWVWVQYQPESELTQWFIRRFAHGGPRARQIGIVAVARRLVIALWRYSRDGVVPPGATLTTRAAA